MRIGLPSLLLAGTLGFGFAACGSEDPVLPGLFEGTVRDFTGAVFAARVEIVPTGPGRIHLRLDYDPEEGTGPGARFMQGDSDGALVEAGGLLRPDAGGLLTQEGIWMSGVFYSALGNPYSLELAR